MTEERQAYEHDNGAVEKRAAEIMAAQQETLREQALAQAEAELATGEQDAEREAERIRLGEQRIEANRRKIAADRRLADAIKALVQAMEHQDAAAQVARRADAACIFVGLPSEYASFTPDLLALGVKGGEFSTGVVQLLLLRELYVSPPAPPPPGRNLAQQLFDASTVAKTLAGGPPKTPIRPAAQEE